MEALQRIETTILDAVQKHENDPQLHPEVIANLERTALKNIAGFSVMDAVAKDKAVVDARVNLKSRVTRYIQDRDQLTSTMAKVGVTPLAMVPLTAWNALCRELGLYRLDPVKGRVYIENPSSDIGKQGEDWIVKVLHGCWAVGNLAVAVALGTLIAPMFALFAVLTAVLSGIILFVPMENMWMKVGRNHGYKAFLQKPWTEQLKALMPDGQSLAIRGSGTETMLRLPIPPAEVAAVLLKLQSFQLQIAAAPGAISFEPSVADMFRQKEIEIAAHEKWIREDPVVFIVNQSAVAIIAQFGDFPDEQAAVQRVINSPYLI